jgi:type II secretory pathway pseudopilin PulG
MIKFFKKNRGESLTEVLVAIGILSIVLVASLVLVNRGTSTNVSVKNKIIAINIAREGIEAIRNIRDTNWLKHSGDRRNKWLCLDTVDITTTPDTINDCTNTGNEITEGKYTVNFNEDLNLFFATKETVNDVLDLSNSVHDFSNYKLYKNNTTARYTHEVSNEAGNPNTKTIFYRQLILVPGMPPECDDKTAGDNYQCDNGSRLHIISRVQWKESNLIGTVVMETYLYDYLGRDKYKY